MWLDLSFISQQQVEKTALNPDIEQLKNNVTWSEVSDLVDRLIQGDNSDICISNTNSYSPGIRQIYRARIESLILQSGEKEIC